MKSRVWNHAGFRSSWLFPTKNLGLIETTATVRIQDRFRGHEVLVQTGAGLGSGLAESLQEKISQLDYIPDKVAILEFKYLEGETVVIRAHALSLEDINRFIYDLQQMEADETW